MKRNDLIRKSDIPRTTLISLIERGLVVADDNGADGEIDLLSSVERLIEGQMYKRAKSIIDAYGDNHDLPNDVIEKLEHKLKTNKYDVSDLNQALHKDSKPKENSIVPAREKITVDSFIKDIRDRADQANMIESLTKKAFYDAELKLLRIAKESGELIDLETIRTANSNIMRILVTKFMGMGIAVIDKIRKEDDMAMQIKIIDDYVHEALSSLNELKEEI